jgi:porin
LSLVRTHIIRNQQASYVQASLIAGIGGRALFFGRPQDSFGLGLSYYDFSNQLQETVNPLNEFHDEATIEAFYSFALTPWFYVTPDIQYIDPANGSYQRALIIALRTQIRF